MIGKSPNRTTPELFRPMLTDFIDLGNELVLLADNIDWDYFEREFAPLYSKNGRPAKPIRLMVGCLLLKQMYGLGDETLPAEWVMNPYMQYFCGETFFQHKFPFDPSDFVHFRKRIGERGTEKILGYTARLHGKDAEEKTVVSDTTVQGNNTEFPTDARLYLQVINKCNAIAKEHGVKQRQTYTETSKSLMRETHNAKHPKRRKTAAKATRKLGTIAGRLVRELERGLKDRMTDELREVLDLLNRALLRDRNQKDKVYSLHKPHTACIAKGKAHQMYEFGNKVGLISTAKTQIILAIQAFPGNPNDGHTVEPLLEQMRRNDLKLPQVLGYDRGGRGVKEACGVEVLTPKPPKRTDTEQEKRKKRHLFRRRAAIEPLIGHLKSDCRMERNYLWEEASSTMNAQLSAAVWNLKKYMGKLKKAFLVLFLRTIYSSHVIFTNIICLSPSFPVVGISDRERLNVAF